MNTELQEANGKRRAAIDRARSFFENGEYLEILRRRVAIATESCNPERNIEFRNYLEQEIGRDLTVLGYSWGIMQNPAAERLPFLIGRRCEDPRLPTVLTYGHADVVDGLDGWTKAPSPWVLSCEGERIYGRGTADNKGQHTICLLAVRAVLEERGYLGFNSVVLIESGEEAGSPGLHEFCTRQADQLAADVLIASDGPRFIPSRPTLFMGTRGVQNFTLKVKLRESPHHSGTRGGLLASASIILANALASIVDKRGTILVDAWRPLEIPPSVRRALAKLQLPADESSDPDWGEPGLTSAERVMGWNSFEILAFEAGNPARPINAIPAQATAHCGLRYVVGTEPATIVPALRQHLDQHGFKMVDIVETERGCQATRVDPDDPWAQWAAQSIERTTGQVPSVIPNGGGTLPNDAFAHVLGMRTLWIPHSYAHCQQHAPDEHLLANLVIEGLEIMAGLFWDVGSGNTPGLMKRL